MFKNAANFFKLNILVPLGVPLDLLDIRIDEPQPWLGCLCFNQWTDLLINLDNLTDTCLYFILLDNLCKKFKSFLLCFKIVNENLNALHEFYLVCLVKLYFLKHCN